MPSSPLFSRRQFIRLSGAATLGLLALGTTTLPNVALAQDSAEFAVGDDVVVATDALNLRSGPGLDYDVLTVLYEGAAGTIEDGPIAADGYTWYQVDVGQDGWVAGDYLFPADNGAPRGLRIQVVDGPLHLRTEPSLSGEIITTLPTGTIMDVLQADGGTWADGYHWIYVQVEDQHAVSGFIADDFVAPVSN